MKKFICDRCGEAFDPGGRTSHQLTLTYINHRFFVYMSVDGKSDQENPDYCIPCLKDMLRQSLQEEHEQS